jgi:hypothetical protein
MKAILITATLVLFNLIPFAQTPKTIVNCWITDGNVNYGPLDQVLPDSIKSRLLVDPRKEFNLKDGNNILLWMEQQGWRLVGVDVSTSGGGNGIASRSTYILAREIFLDDPARAIFLQRLQNLEIKR